MKSSRALGLALGVLLAACNQKAQVEKEPTPLEAKAAAVPAHKFAAPDSFKVGLGKVFEGYERMESALAHDDFPKAKEAFHSMHGLLHVVQTDGLDSSGKAYWDSLDASIMEILHPMAAAQDIAGMRDHFGEFSAQIIDALEKFGAISQLRAFQFHCPMAKDNQGADWLQRDTIMLNPYFGNSMLKCGNLVEEIQLN